jgi:hypothetical protein
MGLGGVGGGGFVSVAGMAWIPDRQDGNHGVREGGLCAIAACWLTLPRGAPSRDPVTVFLAKEDLVRRRDNIPSRSCQALHVSR